MKAKMAENSKGGILKKAEKLVRRRKTQVLQSLGKTGRTTDDLLAEDCQKLEKQQEIATRLQKDLRVYVQSARALSVASKTFYSTLSETYEAEWEGQASVVEILQNMDMLWQDYIQKLQDQVQDRLSKYLACIPQIKTRVAKSRRKLIDYDNAKHNLEVHENAKKKDDAKLTKAKEDLEQAKKIYDDLNNEVHQELPEFYKSRVTFYGEVFKELFEAETKFHTESGKGAEKIEHFAGKLSADNAQFTYTPRKNLRNTIVIDTDVDLTNGHNQSSTDTETPSTSPTTTPATSPTTNEPVVNGVSDTSKDSFDDSTYDNAETKPEKVEEVKQVNGDDVKESEDMTVTQVTNDNDKAEEVTVKQTDQKTVEVKEEPTSQMNGDAEEFVPETAPPPLPVSQPPEEEKDQEQVQVKEETKKEEKDEEKKEELKEEQKEEQKKEEHKEEKKEDDDEDDENIDDENLYQVPPPAKPIDNDLPKNYCYTVQATHSYKGEDEDELSFDSHEIIYVIEYDDPDEQDPGWLMGVRKTDQTCGVFPENFTKRV